MSVNGYKSDIPKIQDVVPDLIVGRMIHGSLQTQVSVRGGNIVLGYANKGRGFEVAYSPKAMEQFNDIVSQAVKVAKGQG